ncbi:hypothetical protein MKX03_015578 [Papaver bracteatum]|nr:hypothetical protein MKX03_015578 [Papaver bracteatum]
MPADRSSTVKESGDDQNHDQYKDSVSNPQSSIRLVITCTNYWGTTLEYGVIAYPDEFSVDSFCINYADAPEDDLENIYYTGPDYVRFIL